MNKLRNVIVTGAGSLIGRALVSEFAKHDSNVFALVHKLDASFEEWCKEAQNENGVKIQIKEIELMDSSSIKVVIKEIIDTGCSLDVLVNNAAVPSERPLMMTGMQEIEDVFRVNFVAPSYITQLVSRVMIRQKKGTIVNVLSRSALEFRAGAYAYGASKAALLWGTVAVAKELSAYNVRVNGIAPGLTNARMGALGHDDDFIKEYMSQNNIKRPADPKEIAKVALFLASDDSSYISGQVISVDGGRVP